MEKYILWRQKKESKAMGYTQTCMYISREQAEVRTSQYNCSFPSKAGRQNIIENFRNPL